MKGTLDHSTRQTESMNRIIGVCVCVNALEKSFTGFEDPATSRKRF